MTGGMNRSQRYALLLLRLTMGWLFLYAGVTKLADPTWSAAGYLAGATTFPAFFTWLGSPSILPITNAMNAWGLTLIGVALMTGVAVRLAAWSGITMMALYYLSALDFPYVGTHSYLIDEHVIYIGALLLLSAFHAGRIWGVGSILAWFPFLRRFRRTLTR